MASHATASPPVPLEAVAAAAREAVAREVRVRRELAAALQREVRRMELGAAETRRVETALTGQLARIAEALSRPPRRWVRVGESRVLGASESLASAVFNLADAAAEVGAAAGEQLRKRQELHRSFRRIPDLSHAAERSRRHLGTAFRSRAIGAVAGRLTTTGRVLARFRAGRAVLSELNERLTTLMEPLDHARAELGFFACRAHAVTLSSSAAGGRRREEVELVVDPGGALMLAWDRAGVPRVTIYPVPAVTWRLGFASWHRCFALPQGGGNGQRLRVVRPALAVWAGAETARLVRTGVLDWGERGHPAPAREFQTPSSPEEG